MFFQRRAVNGITKKERKQKSQKIKEAKRNVFTVLECNSGWKVSEIVWVIITSQQGHCLWVNEAYLCIDICMIVSKSVILVTVYTLTDIEGI